MLRVTAHVRTATFRWSRRDRRLPRRRERPGRSAGGQLQAGHPQSRRPRLLLHAPLDPVSGTGAHLAWRIKNGAKSVPLKTLKTLPDGSELVMLHESDGMRARRRGGTGDLRAERLPDTTARLVTFTITATTRSGRTKTTRMWVLTTLLDHEAYPAGNRRPVCRKMANRNRVPPFQEDRPRPPPAAARPVSRTGPPGSLGAAAHPQHHRHRICPRRRNRRHRPRPHPVHRRARPHPLPRRRRNPCRHCGHRPASPLASLNTAILALPRHRQGRQRTSGRTAAERRTRHTEEVTYTIEITKSNLPKWDTSPET